MAMKAPDATAPELGQATKFVTPREAAAAALAWANERNAERGRPQVTELRPGVRDDSTCCALGNTTGLTVDKYTATDPDTGRETELPEAVRAFVAYFEAPAGSYFPELVLEG